jgi:glycerophosphoryl diester phosphodiesterase
VRRIRSLRAIRETRATGAARETTATGAFATLAALALVGCNGAREPAATPGPSPTPASSPSAAAERAVMRGIVAHRGASAAAPENTLAALRLGWSMGAESCEIDVRVTADGQVVLMHDATTGRTAGRDDAVGVAGAAGAAGTTGTADLEVATSTLADLRRLDVGAWKDARYRGERVPTLGEALDATPPARMLFVEIKTGADDADTIAAAIRAADPRARGADVALQAYDPDALAAVAARLPGVAAYWTVDPPIVERDGRRFALPYPPALAQEAAGRGFAGVAIDHRAAGAPDDPFVAAVAAAGLVLDVWTVNDAAAIGAWRARGARWIETDHPELAGEAAP